MFDFDGDSDSEKEFLNENTKEEISLKIDQIYNDYNKNISIYKLSKLCRIIGILISKYGNTYIDDIINVAKFLTFSENKNIKLNEDFKEKIIGQYPQEVKLNEEEIFFFKVSSEIGDFFALLYICFITHTHLCIEGKTGIGKTACAKAFSEILKKLYEIDNYKIFSFNNETVPHDFYGSLTLNENKNITFYNGVLSDCILLRSIFIADELNLTSEETMNSLGPVLEENFNYKIYFPGLNIREKINNKFLFVSCQNLSTTLGRKKFTNLLKSRLKQVSYPEQNINRIKDFENICENMNRSLNNSIGNSHNFKNEQARKIGRFILKFNEKNEGLIYNLNFRDVKKILKREYYQEKNTKYYQGFNLYNNILLYIMSQTKEEDKNKMSKYLINLLAEIFNERNYDYDYDYNRDFYFEIALNGSNNSKISEKIKVELQDIYDSEAKFIEENGIIYLSKGKCKINVNNILTETDKKNILDYNKLNTFLESLFLSKLALNDEPLLILGDTGYKTYLSEKLLTSKPSIINLNSKIKLNYLLGSSMFFSRKEAGEFYLKNILNIVIDDYDKNEKFNYFKQYINEKGKITDNEIKERLNSDIIKYENLEKEKYKYKISHKFFEKLINDVNKNQNIILENIVLEYNPGLITYSYLGNENIILKNLSYLETSIVERFNELFSESQIITLNEDIHKTFTEKDDKILKFNHIRIIATSYPEYESKLSEAIASRFTILQVNSYNEQEENIMLKLYSKENNLKIKETVLKVLEDFFFDYKNTFNKKIYINQKLNILNILSCFNNTEKNEVKNAKLTLFLLMKNSFNNKKESNIKKLKEILDENFEECKKGEEPFTKMEEDGRECILSKITKLHLEINKRSDSRIQKERIFFHKDFSELLNIIHFSIFCKTGLIIEGMDGQGKKTAIKYIASLLGYNLLNIYLNESTKIEDILGNFAFDNDDNNELKMVNVRTDFISSLNKKNYKIIIFHNVNKANSSIIELITDFYRKKKDIYITNLNKITPQYKYNFFISIFTSENSIKGKDYLPSSLIQNSIYYQMENNAINYLSKIVEHRFIGHEFIDENKEFSNAFLSVYKYEKNEMKESNESVLSLNEIDKFLKLRQNTFTKLDINIILSFIFIFRYSNDEIREKIKNKIKIKYDDINTSIKLVSDMGCLYLEIKLNDKYYYLPFQNMKEIEEKNINIEEINKNLVSLTGPQRYCLLFLSCCYISNKPCILQGETSSGKTHLIHLFANMLGKKLKIYQMNNDSNVILINGQSKFEDLRSDEIDKLKDLKTKLEELLNNDNILKENDITVEKIGQLLEQANKFISSESSFNNRIEEIKRIKNEIIKIISPINRFRYNKSSFCESLEKGEWILIEQIESAPPEILERLIPLTQENPEIKIIQGTKEIIYKYKAPKNSEFDNNLVIENNINKDDINENKDNIKYISPDFRIFFTYNPDKVDIKANQTLLNKCLTFTLPRNDSSIKYLTQILYGILRKANFDKISALEFSKRFSNVHQIVKEKIKLNPEDFSGKMQFTGRTINFISNYLSKKISQLKRIDRQNIGSIITESLKIFYWNSFQNKTKLSNMKFDTIKKFKENINVEIIKEEEEIKLNYKELNNIVEKINLYLKNPQNNDLIFSFESMVKSCEKIKFVDIDIILTNLKKTVEYASKAKSNIPENKLYLIMKINIIIFLLEEIKKEGIPLLYRNYTLSSIEDKNIFSKTSKLLFLSRIIDKKKLFNIPSIISSIYYSNRNNIIKLLELINDFIEKNQGSFVLFKKII